RRSRARASAGRRSRRRRRRTTRSHSRSRTRRATRRGRAPSSFPVLAELAPLLGDEPLELQEQRAIALAHGLEEGREDGPGGVEVAAEQALQHPAREPVLELLAAEAHGVEERALLLPPDEQPLLVEAVERRHERGVGVRAAERLVDVAHRGLPLA